MLEAKPHRDGTEGLSIKRTLVPPQGMLLFSDRR